MGGPVPIAPLRNYLGEPLGRSTRLWYAALKLASPRNVIMNDNPPMVKKL